MKEIERKWLLRETPDKDSMTNIRIIRQGYLCNGIRLRRSFYDGKEGYLKSTITKKVGAGLVRDEIESEVETIIIESLFMIPGTIELMKSRTDLIGFPKLIIDKYWLNLEGLVVAEQEFLTEEEAKDYIPPPILQEKIIREVTDDSRYDNYSLAMSQAVPTEI